MKGSAPTLHSSTPTQPIASFATFETRHGSSGAGDARELLPHLAALERAQLVDHQHAVQVIELVLDRDGQQAVRLELERATVSIEGAHRDALGALDLFTHPGEREASLAPRLRAARLDDLGIDEDPEIARLVLPGAV